MKMDTKMVFVILLFMMAIVHNAWSQSTANADEENHVESADRLTVLLGGEDGGGDGDQHAAESVDDPQQQQQSQQQQHEPDAASTTGTATAVAKKGDRSGRQLYQPFAYQPAFAQRRAYRGPKKRPPSRNKPGGRRPRPHRRRPSGPPPGSAGRYRRLPGPVRQQHVNYIDAPSADYYDDDVYEVVGGGGGGSGPQSQSAAVVPYVDYVEQREFDRDPGAAYAVMPAPLHAVTGRTRKRPAVGGYADEPQVVHVPVLRVIRPTVVAATTASTSPVATPAAATEDPMEKLRQLVHEAMDAHFANRHQDLYSADGTFDNKRQQPVYSAKYKRQPAAADRDNGKADAARSTAAPAAAKGNGKDHVLQYVSYATPPPPPQSPRDAAADVDADGSDDRLTLAEISAYMGAKPAETVLSAGGHRYVLSDALQQTYRHHQPEQQPRYGGDAHHQYLRYVSPFEAMYELPAARWAYK